MTDNNELLTDFVNLSHQQMEDKYHKKYDTLRKFANACGVNRKHIIGGRPPIYMDWKLMHQEYESGKTLHELKNKYKVSASVIAKNFNSLGLKIRNLDGKCGHRRYNFDEAFFEKVDTEAKAYIFGFIMADGCLYSGKKNNNLLRVNIHKDDMEILQFMKSEMKSESPINLLKNNSIDIKLFSQKMYDDLVKLGCTERKSLTLQFPIIDDVLLPHFIRGYFDGDGTITFSCKNKSVKTFNATFYSSYDFCSSLNKIMNIKFGFGPKAITKMGNIAKVSYSSFDEIRKMHGMLYSSSTFWLKRKRDKMEELMHRLANQRSQVIKS
jgi:hypothetical protein